MKKSCSGVILSGGLNTRFDGKDKAFVRVGGRPMIEQLLDVFRPLFEDIVLVTNEPVKYLSWDLHVVTDIVSCRSSLTGIHAGLFHAAHPHAFFAACDAPFLQTEIVHTLLEALGASVDVVIPETGAGLEPLCAIYSKRCLAAIEKLLVRQQYKIQSFFPSVRVMRIKEEPLRAADPELISFFNINSPEDLARAETWLETGQHPRETVKGDADV
jgi:molybdopterin-guanine dinucleotide biosynthesis protein A